MIYWNEWSQEVLKKYFDSMEKSSNSWFNFLLLDWPSNVGKTSLVQDFSKNLLWNFFEKDFMWVYDFSQYLGKKHFLKISNKEKESFIEIPELWKFQNLWVRELTVWLSKSSLSGFKILFLENIERMTVSASNAFLKTFEEPLEKRIIIATTSNSNSLLDTIISRAFVLKFDTMEDNFMYDVLKKQYSENVSDEYLKFVVYFSMWRLWLAKKILEWEKDKDFKRLKEIFDKFVDIFEKKGFFTEKLTYLKELEKMGYLEIFLDVLTSYLSKKNKYFEVEKVLKVKSMIEANVSKENSFFYMIT